MIYFLKKIKDLIKYIFQRIFPYGSKPVNPKKYKKCIYKVSDRDLNFHFSDTVVIEFSYMGKKYFFRECETHGSRKNYLKNLICLYFDVFQKSSEYSKSDKEKLLSDLSKTSNISKFFGFDYNDDALLCVKFCNGTIDSEKIGICNNNDIEYTNRIRAFVKYASIKVKAYLKNDSLVFSRKTQNSDACKLFAYLELSDVLDIQDYVPKTQYGFLEINDKFKLFGTITEDAGGVIPHEISKNERIKKITPIFQKNLLNLSVLDYICHILDHTMYNYNITVDKYGNFESIKAFDNTEPSAFSIQNDMVFKGLHGESPYIIESGTINRPHLDIALADKIYKINKYDLQKKLKSFLSKQQIKCVLKRIEFVKNAIPQTLLQKPNFLLKNSEWNQKTIEDELSGIYGKTYLVKLTEPSWRERINAEKKTS